MSSILTPTGGPGSPVGTANPDHQPRVPMAGGVPPYCSCGVVGGDGITAPLLADHLREMDPGYGSRNYIVKKEEENAHATS